MTAEGGGAAGLNVTHGFCLLRADRMLCTVEFPVAAKDLRDLKMGPHRSRRLRQSSACTHAAHRTVVLRPVWHIQWAFDATDPMGAHVGIACGGSDGAVSEQSLNDSEIGPGFQEVSGKGVS